MQTELNIINLLCNNIITRFEQLEEKGLIFHKQKQRGKAFIKELEKLTDVIVTNSKETDIAAYNLALEEMHQIDNKLDNFLNTIYDVHT